MRDRRRLITAAATAASVTVAVVLVCVGAAAVAADDRLLDGKRFSGETGKKGDEKGDAEEFVFEKGTFDPLGCHPWGFGAAPYTAKRIAGIVQFESTTVSAKEGKMAWTGRVRGDRIEGTMVWTKEGQAPAEYWFRGNLKTE